MRRFVLSLLALGSCLALAASSAQAIVVDMNPADLGNTSVSYSPDHSYYYGVSLVPGSRDNPQTYLAGAGIPFVKSSSPCADPAAGTEPDILTAGSWPLDQLVSPICWHSGQVMHANETFAVEWEGSGSNTYWATTKQYVQTYLSDVAAASGALDNPYADTTQYWDGPSAQDRAANMSVFGGGCDDNGTATCQFGGPPVPGGGNKLPSSSDCPLGGENIFGGSGAGGTGTVANNLCLTDSDVQHEVVSLIDNDGLIKQVQPGYTPLVVVLTPPGVEVCLDSAGVLCSANGRLAPQPPSVLTAQSGGSVAAGTYQIVETYTTGSGESLPSVPASVTTTGAQSTITVSPPPPVSGETGWSVYMTQPGGLSFTLQQSGINPNNNYTLSVPPTSSGAAPPLGAAAFCSYHGQVTDPQSGKTVSYLVQPWTAFTVCDEPDVPSLPPNPLPPVLENNAGMRLVSPLSQSQMAAIVNPFFTGWFGIDGSEIDDQNSCQPLSQGLDQFQIGSTSYYLQREFSNAAVVDSDPYTYGGCLPSNALSPVFVAPSAVNLGDTLELDGSATATSLGIPNANYQWNFGDGSTASGPSVEHTYGAAGSFTVTLTVTDRGGNKSTATETVQVLGSNGLPVPAPVVTTPSGPTGPTSSNAGFNVTLRLLPQALASVVRHGIFVRVSSNQAADGLAQILISRRAARRAHIKIGHKAMIVVGIGTVSGIKNGTIQLALHMRHLLAKKLGSLHHVNITVRLMLVGADGQHLAIDVAGRY
jgi:hypothetical protein